MGIYGKRKSGELANWLSTRDRSVIPVGDSSNNDKTIARMKTGHRFSKLPWCSSTRSWIPKRPPRNILSILDRVDEFYVSICTDYMLLYDIWESIYLEARRKNVRVPFISHVPVSIFGFVDPRDIVIIAYPTTSMKMILRYLRYNPDVYPLFFVRETTDIEILNNSVWDISSNGKIIIAAKSTVARYVSGIVRKVMKRREEVIVDNNIMRALGVEPRHKFMDIDESIIVDLLNPNFLTTPSHGNNSLS